MDPKFTRREFIGTSAKAAGAIALTPAGISSYFFGPDAVIRNPALTPLSVKFIQTGVIHQETFEGSCRTGQLEQLTMDAETRYFQTALDVLKQELTSQEFNKGINILQPEATSDQPVATVATAVASTGTH